MVKVMTEATAKSKSYQVRLPHDVASKFYRTTGELDSRKIREVLEWVAQEHPEKIESATPCDRPKRYTLATKINAVKCAIEKGGRVAAQEYNVPYDTLNKWKADPKLQP